MVQTPYRRFPLSEEDALFLRTVADDTEEAPWMVMGDLQLWAASGLAWSLRHFGQRQGRAWYVASMLPIYYPRPDLPEQGFVAPDVLVAFVPDHARTSYDLDEEGVFPPFCWRYYPSPASPVTRLRSARRMTC
jgi:hypothetical protein